MSSNNYSVVRDERLDENVFSRPLLSQAFVRSQMSSDENERIEYQDVEQMGNVLTHAELVALCAASEETRDVDYGNGIQGLCLKSETGEKTYVVPVENLAKAKLRYAARFDAR